MKLRGQNYTLSVGLFMFYHGYPRDGLPWPKSGYSGLLWVFPSARRHEQETIRQHKVIKGIPKAALLPLSCLPHHSVPQVSPLSLIDDPPCPHPTVGSSSRSPFFNSEFLLPLHCQSDVPRCTSPQVFYPMSLLPLLGPCFILFHTQSFLPQPNTFKIIFNLEPQQQQKVLPITAQLLFITQTFEKHAFLLLVLTMTTCMHLTASLWYCICPKVFS